MFVRRGVILGAALLAFAAWTTPATGGPSNYGSEHLATECTVNQTSWGPMITAQTSWRVWSAYESPDGYRWKARLIPSNPGLNFMRTWNQVEVPAVGTEAPTSYDGTVTTPPMSADLDWNLQVKLTWDRANHQDWNVEHVLDFDERACTGA